MNLINFLLPKIESLGSLAYVVIAFVGFLESTAFVGLIVPGSTIVVIAGILAAQGVLNLGNLIIAVALGGILGDALAFFLGKKYGSQLFRQNNKIFKLEYLKKGEEFFLAHGQKSILFARFFGPVRPIVPFVAGLFKMPTNRFVILNIVSAFLSAPFYLLLGYFFGTAWSQVGRIAGRLQTFLLLLGIVLVGLYFFKNSILKKGRSFFTYVKIFWLSAIKQMVHFSAWEKFSVQHHGSFVRVRQRLQSLRIYHSLPITLFLYFLFFILAFSGAIQAFIHLAPIQGGDKEVANFFYNFRHPVLVVLFLIITWFGSSQGITAVSILAGVWWFRRREWYFFLALFFTIILSTLSMFFIKQLVQQTRPDSTLAVYAEKLFSFPSGHTTLAVALYGFIIFSVCYGAKNWNKKVNQVFLGGIIIFLISLSRLYLGVHYLSDVIGGYILGLLCLLLGIELARLIMVAKIDKR